MKHTVGPWYVSKKNTLRIIESGPRRLTLATVSTTGRGVTAETAQAEAEANARAMAAVPELIAACEAIDAYGKADESDSAAKMLAYNKAIKAARAGISKATGGAP